MTISKILKKLLWYFLIALFINLLLKNSLFTTKVIDIQKLLDVVEKAVVMSYCFALSHLLTERRKAVPFLEFKKERRTLAIWLFSLILGTIILFCIVKGVQFKHEINWSKEFLYGTQISCLLAFLMLLFSGSINFKRRKEELN